MSADPRMGLSVTHRRYIPYSHAHYGGDLIDGAYVLAMFGDVATEVCIRTDGDEGLFASYSDVRFLAPVRAGDVLEATATVTRVGRRSRELSFEARVVCRSRSGESASAVGQDSGGAPAGAGAAAEPVSPSAATVLDPPVVAVAAVGTVVVPASATGDR
jgi:3-aminobutyryl-CoA ammonia-lyase